MRTHCVLLSAGLLALALPLAYAQAPPDLEPGVQTSPVPSPAPASATTPARPAAQAPASDGKPAATQHRAPASTAAAPAPAAPGNSKDRIQLDTTQISGNRELPKVMYVVPWRRADPGEFAGRPPNSLLDEALTPVDRDVFRRQNRYYAALQGGAAGPAPAASQSGGKGAAQPAPETKDEK